jgi:hypothetical protein
MDFNLQLSKYSIQDLQSMFKLGEKYTVDELDEKATIIRTQLVTVGMDETVKGNLTRFLSEAKKLLSKEVSGNGMIPTPPIYLPSKPVEYVAGAVNPYERRTLKKNICVDSIFRNGQTATDFTYTLPETIKSAVTMRLAAIEIPSILMFSVRNQSNTFRLIVRNGPGLVEEAYTITIPEGNYEQWEMTQILNTAIVAQATFVIGVVTTHNTTIRFRNIGEGDSVFDVSGPCYAPTATMQVDFAVEGKILYTTAGWTLGYRAEVVDSPAVSVTPFAAPAYVFLEVDDFQNNFQTDSCLSTNGMSYLGKNLLSRVALGSTLPIIQNTRDYFGPVRLDKLHFRLLTRFGEVVDLGGADFSFVLEFTTIYS